MLVLGIQPFEQIHGLPGVVGSELSLGDFSECVEPLKLDFAEVDARVLTAGGSSVIDEVVLLSDTVPSK
jgi:hypothetical protein